MDQFTADGVQPTPEVMQCIAAIDIMAEQEFQEFNRRADFTYDLIINYANPVKLPLFTEPRVNVKFDSGNMTVTKRLGMLRGNQAYNENFDNLRPQIFKNLVLATQAVVDKWFFGFYTHNRTEFGV